MAPGFRGASLDKYLFHVSFATSRLLERAALGQICHVVFNSLAFARQKPLYRIGERGLRQPVHAGGFDRHQRTCHFVFTLRAAFKALETVLDAPLQRLVVAGLKMQAIDALQGAQ